MISVQTGEKCLFVVTQTEKRLLQEAVSTLIDTKRHQPEDDDPGRLSVSKEIFLLEALLSQINAAQYVDGIDVVVTP